MRRTFQALSSVVSVTLDDDLPGHDVAEVLLAGYPNSDRPPQLAFELRGGEQPVLRCAGRYDTRVERAEDLVPLFELDLYHLLADLADPGWLLHAAALEHDGKVVVLAGPSGAGKTTLALALLERKWRLVSEEIALIGHDRLVRGLARPIHLDSDRAHPAIPEGWTRLDYPIRRGANITRHAIAQPPSGLRAFTPRPLHALVRIDHDLQQPSLLSSMAPHRAFVRLWECTLRQDDNGLAAATGLLAAQRTFELVSCSISQAVALAEQLVTL